MSGEDEATAGARRARGATIAMLVVGAAVVVGIFVATQSVGPSEERQKVANAWSRYARCLIGDAPLGPGESLQVRLARVELAAFGDPKAAGWPARCASLADDFTAAAHALADRDERYKSIAFYADNSFPLTVIQTGTLSDLFRMMESSQLPAPTKDTSSPEVPVAPAPLHALTLDRLPVVASGSDVYNATTEDVPGTAVRLLWSSWPRRYCRVEPPFEVARCGDLSPSIAGGAALSFAPMADDALEPLLAVDDPKGAVRVVRGFSGVDVGPPADGWVLGDQLLTTSPKPGKTEILARPIGDSAATPKLLATVDGDYERSIHACRTTEALAVLVDTESAVHVLFHAVDGWTPPVTTAWSRPRVQRLTCRGREATLTTFDKRVVKQLRCTPSGCVAAESAPLSTDAYDRDMELDQAAVTEVDGKILLVGTGDHPSTLSTYIGGVHFRMAPLADLAAARDDVLVGVDDDNHGIDWDFVQVFARGTSALVLVRESSQRFYLTRIDASGAIAPVRLERLP